MNRMIIVLFCVLCLLLSGCKSAAQPSPSEAFTPSTVTVPDTAVESQSESTGTPADPCPEASGKLRIPYTGNRSGIRYISSPSQLPPDEIFDPYDETFFQAHGLLLITETVSSGSVDISIESVSVEGEQGRVLLRHNMPGEAGTTDMATWLLWIAVDPGLDLHWVVTNPAIGNTSDIPTS